jgi:hypothetical protein
MTLNTLQWVRKCGSFKVCTKPFKPIDQQVAYSSDVRSLYQITAIPESWSENLIIVARLKLGSLEFFDYI